MATMTERATVPNYPPTHPELDDEIYLAQRRAELIKLHEQRQKELAQQAYEQYQKDLEEASGDRERADDLNRKYQELLRQSTEASVEEIKGAIQREKAFLEWSKYGKISEEMIETMREEQQQIWDNAMKANEAGIQSRRPSIISEVRGQKDNNRDASSSSRVSSNEQTSHQARSSSRPNDVWIPPPSAAAEASTFPTKKQRSVSGLSQTRPPEVHVDRRISSFNYPPRPSPKSSTYFGAPNQPLVDEPEEETSDSDSEEEEQAESQRARRPINMARTQESRRPSVDVPIALRGPQKFWKPSTEDLRLHPSPKTPGYVPAGLGTSPKSSDFITAPKEDPAHNRTNISASISRATNVTPDTTTKDHHTATNEEREAANVHLAEKKWKELDAARDKGQRNSSFSTPHHQSESESRPSSKAAVAGAEIEHRDIPPKDNTSSSSRNVVHPIESIRSPSAAARLSSEHHDVPRTANEPQRWYPPPPTTSGPRMPDPHQPRSTPSHINTFPDSTLPQSAPTTPQHVQDPHPQMGQRHNTTPLARSYTDEPAQTQHSNTPLSRHNTDNTYAYHSVPFPHKEDESSSRPNPIHLKPPEQSRPSRVESNASTDSRPSWPPPSAQNPPPISRARTPEVRPSSLPDEEEDVSGDTFETSHTTNYAANESPLFQFEHDPSEFVSSFDNLNPDIASKILEELTEEEIKIKREREALEREKQEYLAQMKEREEREAREKEKKERDMLKQAERMQQREKELESFEKSLRKREEALAKREAEEKLKGKREADRLQREMDMKREEIQRRQQAEILAQYERKRKEDERKEEIRKAEQARLQEDARQRTARPASTASFATFSSTSSSSSGRTSTSSTSQTSASSGWSDTSRTSASSNTTRPTSTASSNTWSSTPSPGATSSRATPSPSNNRPSASSTPKSSQSGWRASDTSSTHSTAGGGGGGSSSFTGSEYEWQKRQEEQARKQQEQFHRESQRLEKEKQTKATQSLSKEQVIKAWNSYEQDWASLKDQASLRFRTIPWPVLTPPKSPDDLTTSAIGAFVLSPHTLEKAPKDRLKEQLLRWHPDRFENKWLVKVDAGDKDLVKQGAGQVVRSLNELLGRENSSPFG